jgi:hypothetical protein
MWAAKCQRQIAIAVVIAVKVSPSSTLADSEVSNDVARSERYRGFADSSLEQRGFELLVPPAFATFANAGHSVVRLTRRFVIGTGTSNPVSSSVESSANLTPMREHATEPDSRAVLRMPWRPQVIDVFRALTTAAVALANAAKIVMVRTVPRHSRARTGTPLHTAVHQT